MASDTIFREIAIWRKFLMLFVYLYIVVSYKLYCLKHRKGTLFFTSSFFIIFTIVYRDKWRVSTINNMLIAQFLRYCDFYDIIGRWTTLSWFLDCHSYNYLNPLNTRQNLAEISRNELFHPLHNQQKNTRVFSFVDYNCL